MSRKNIHVKKSVPFKLKGSVRNPFGDNVIIDREDHYGSNGTKNSPIQRSPSQSAFDHTNRAADEKSPSTKGVVRKLTYSQSVQKLGDKSRNWVFSRVISEIVLRIPRGWWQLATVGFKKAEWSCSINDMEILSIIGVPGTDYSTEQPGFANEKSKQPFDKQ